MSPEENKLAVQRAFQTFASGKRDKILALFTSDAESLAPRLNATAVALGVTHHMIGPEQIAHFLIFEFKKLFVSTRRPTVDSRGRRCASSGLSGAHVNQPIQTIVEVYR
jgi:uncharacterized protein